ncbi:hypothetical protein [Halobaculum litoreum]|uniref:Uncharacterized protein n=1 Tax=Halobaculum litoreum TaxID=3031998 RepID=A0ABD5XPU7_9EURY|nr:hypothetical protein [Halobaculum sp. DT92]
MRLTRRGKAVVAAAVVAVASGLVFGPRSLNAVVVPALVALGAAYLQLRWADPRGPPAAPRPTTTSAARTPSNCTSATATAPVPTPTPG